MRRSVCPVLAVLLLGVALVPAIQAQPRVGPATGAVVVVGGGSLGPEIYRRFIELAGGPDALIIDVPTAGGDSVYPAESSTTRAFRAAGARNVVVLHTIDRKLADSDSFSTLLSRAGGVWFDGGRQWHLVDRYAGTRSEAGFRGVLERGGVVGGTSAGASILSSYLLRGARSGNQIIMAPGYEVGFGYLRNVAIDQHVVARNRLPDLADSLVPRRPDLLGISEDEGTAWVVRGDTGEIIGRGKAFVYGGHQNDPGRPFLTLRPGDRYDLGARVLLARAADGTRLSDAFVDSLLAPFTGDDRQATVLVARNGRMLVNRAYGVPEQPRFTPTTQAPQWSLGGLAALPTMMARHLIERDGLAIASDSARAELIRRRIFGAVGANRTMVSASGEISSSVDDLFRVTRGLDEGTWGAPTAPSIRLYGTPDGHRNAYVREGDVTIAILSSSDATDARAIAEALLSRLRP